jgi:hypothetical protein
VKTEVPAAVRVAARRWVAALEEAVAVVRSAAAAERRWAVVGAVEAVGAAAEA